MCDYIRGSTLQGNTWFRQTGKALEDFLTRALSVGVSCTSLTVRRLSGNSLVRCQFSPSLLLHTSCKVGSRKYLSAAPQNLTYHQQAVITFRLGVMGGFSSLFC